MFKHIYLFTFDQLEALSEVRLILKNLGVSIVEDVAHSDLIMVLGGDGTILHQAKLAHHYQIPIVGINLGCRGFLADIETISEESIQAILNGEVSEEHKPVLRCQIDGQKHFAINEVMIAKSKPTRMISYEVIVDKQRLYHQTADGVIVCTTTGSSAYALSAGGPILHPKSQTLGLIPVASNRITSLPMVLHQDAKIEIIVHEWKDSEAMVAVDAQEVKTARSHTLGIEVDEKPLRLLHTKGYDYYQTLKRKVNWESSPKDSC